MELLSINPVATSPAPLPGGQPAYRGIHDALLVGPEPLSLLRAGHA